jgi:hypothetical protein
MLTEEQIALFAGRYTEEQVRDFIKYIFDMLWKGNVCFSSGTFIINDSNNLFFNLLLYNEFIPSEGKVRVADNAPLHVTHNEPIRGIEKEIYLDTHPLQKAFRKAISNHKYERSFNPPIKGLCGGKAEDKGVCLFYQYKSPSDNKQYLFLKFEKAPFLTLEHVARAAVHYSGIGRKPAVSETSNTETKDAESEQGSDFYDHDTELGIRRETHKQCNHSFYNDTYSKQDNGFYKNIVNPLCGMTGLERGGNPNFRELQYYNKNVRVGCEFYISELFMLNMAVDFAKKVRPKSLDKEEPRLDVREEYHDRLDQVLPDELDSIGGRNRRRQRKHRKKHTKKQHKRSRRQTKKHF